MFDSFEVPTGNFAKYFTEEAKMRLKKKSGVGMLVVLSAVLAGSGVARAGDQVPFKGSETGVREFLGFEFPLFTIGFSSSGKASHVGKYTGEGRFVINALTDEAFANITLTAANGDQVFVDLDYLFLTSTTSLITGTITGGTGRFEDASGGYEYFLEMEFSRNVFPNPFTGTWSGTISSPGSNGRTEASAEPDALIRQRVEVRRPQVGGKVSVNPWKLEAWDVVRRLWRKSLRRG